MDSIRNAILIAHKRKTRTEHLSLTLRMYRLKPTIIQGTTDFTQPLHAHLTTLI